MTFWLQFAIFSHVSNQNGTCRIEVEFLPWVIFVEKWYSLLSWQRALDWEVKPHLGTANQHVSEHETGSILTQLLMASVRICPVCMFPRNETFTGERAVLDQKNATNPKSIRRLVLELCFLKVGGDAASLRHRHTLVMSLTQRGKVVFQTF